MFFFRKTHSNTVVHNDLMWNVCLLKKKIAPFLIRPIKSHCLLGRKQTQNVATFVVRFLCVGGVSDPLCFSSSSALHFSHYYFLVHHPVNQDDLHHLAHAMASDFTVAWQFLRWEQLIFLVRIKLPTRPCTRDRCYDYLNFFAEKFGEKNGVFDWKQR
jgi:hypothetical protein